MRTPHQYDNILPPEEERGLFGQLRSATGNSWRAIRDQIFFLFKPVADRIARKRSRSRWADRSDFEQDASVALLRCIDGFDPERDVPFAAYVASQIPLALRGRLKVEVITLTEEVDAVASDTGAALDAERDRVEFQTMVADRLHLCSPEERVAIQLRFGMTEAGRLTLAEISRQIGCNADYRIKRGVRRMLGELPAYTTEAKAA